MLPAPNINRQNTDKKTAIIPKTGGEEFIKGDLGSIPSHANNLHGKF
jgi:hypothetical protein